MKRFWLVGVVAVAVGACELESVEDRISLELTGGAPVQRIDLDPASVASGIDNTVTVAVRFDALPNSSTGVGEPVSFAQYRIDFRLNGEEAPFIAGELELELRQGESASATLRAATDVQLRWALDRYEGGELDVPATVQLAGIYGADEELIIVSHDFVATFADYE